MGSARRIDVAPPAFLRTLDHGTAVTLTGNVPPALVSTHAYYQQRRWLRLVGEDVAARHSAMHTGTGPTTSQRWTEENWPHDLPDTPTPEPAAVRPARGENPGVSPGSLGTALNADYRPILCNRLARDFWGPAGAAIPDQRSSEPGRWRAVNLPADLAAYVGEASVNLADPATRRDVLPMWLETGPAELLSATVPFPLLRAEWPHLPISDLLREVWEDCYPALGDDIA